MVDAATKKTLSGIPLCKTKAGPRDKEIWVNRLKEEYQSLIKYVSNNIPITFERWGSWGYQEPSNNYNENCVRFVASTERAWRGPDDAWSDYDCRAAFRYICEKDTN